MKQFNKLEELLEELVKDSIIHSDDAVLVFNKSNKLHQVNIIFDKDKKEPFYIMTCYFNSIDNLYQNDGYLKFEIPIVHAYDFIKKHLNKEKHHLLDYPKGINFLSANIYYNELLKITESHKYFSSIFLSASLQNELSNNLKHNPKLKI